MSIRISARAQVGDFSLDVEIDSPARVLALVGASGSGKTTLLNVLAGLVPAQRCRLTIDGEPWLNDASSPPARERRFGYVFQDVRLFPHLSVEGNLRFAQRHARAPVDPAPVLEMLGIGALLHRRPATLSGGEARRVAIARALCAAPRLLLLDEPYTGVDLDRRQQITPYLRRLREETRLPIILVSHEAADVAALADDVVELRAGRARHPPEETSP